ncbi:MAG: hypothetical protein ABL962_05305 [Fimbriimonadaceae bacterium]
MRKLAILLLVHLASASHAGWSVVFLHPSGAVASECYAANGSNQGGWVRFGTWETACLWSGTKESIVDLHPNGATGSAIHGLSATQQVGVARINNVDAAGLWLGSKASFTNLGPSSAFAVGGGVQAGTADSQFGFRARLWRGSSSSGVNLGPNLTGLSYSDVRDLEGDRQIGTARLVTFEAGMWAGTAESWVSLHPSGSQGSFGNAISGNRQVGANVVNDLSRACMWSGTAESIVDLHPLEAVDSTAFDVLDEIQVGQAGYGSGSHACAWYGTSSTFLDLHNLLPSGFTRSVARRISSDANNYYIVGYAQNSATGFNNAVMWVRPKDEFVLNLNRSTVAGQNHVLGTITLLNSRPFSIVFSVYDNSSLVTTPGSVTVAANTLSRNFHITTSAISGTVNVTIYARLGGKTVSRPLTLGPLVPTAMSFSPNQVIGGNSVTCYVVVNGVAGPGGRVLSIFDNSTHVQVPQSVVVPAGSTRATFTVVTSPVNTSETAVITARVTAGETSGHLRILR